MKLGIYNPSNNSHFYAGNVVEIISNDDTGRHIFIGRINAIFSDGVQLDCSTEFKSHVKNISFDEIQYIKSYLKFS